MAMDSSESGDPTDNHRPATAGRRVLVAAAVAMTLLSGGCAAIGDQARAKSYTWQEPISGAEWRRDSRVLTVVDSLPYQVAQSTPLAELGRVDKSGVLRYRRNDRRHYHPVKTVQFVLDLHANWQINRDDAYLDRAIANMDALLKRTDKTKYGPYFPYTFDFPLHGDADNTIRAPWYSAMAQGQVLSALIRLYEATGDNEWLDRAGEVFTSLATVYGADQVTNPDMQPWTTFVDQDGFLWFEEYAGGGVPPMRVLNGHIFAIYGLYDFWRVTKSATAEALLDGGLATVVHYVPRLRVEGEPSWYGMRIRDNPKAQSPTYHRIHVAQLRQLGRFTGDPIFNTLADQLESDFR